MDFGKMMGDLSIDKVRNLAEDAFNQVKPKNGVEARVYEVLSHKNWGASSTLMNEIAQDTFDYERFLIVTKLMWEAVETPRPSAWRVIFKGLTLLEHLVKNGSERCVDDARNHSHLLRNMEKFNYYEGTVDRGVGVREKSRQIVEMLGDDERIREERMKARQLREKFAGRGMAASNKGQSRSGGGGGGGGRGSSTSGYGNSDAAWARAGSSTSGTRATGRYGGSVPDAKPASSTRVKKSKKKERKEKPAPAAAAPEVDLFSFDAAPAPTPSAAAGGGGDAFDAFQAAPAPSAATTAPLAPPPAPPAAAANDDFGDFAAASSTAFDAFGSAPAAPAQPAFGAQPPVQMQQPAMGDAFGSPMQPVAAAPTSSAGGDDDFGDFADSSGDAGASGSSPSVGGEFGGLVNLGGLSKNTKKETKAQEPAFNATQQSFGMGAMQQPMKQQTMPAMSMGGGLNGGNGMMGGGVPTQQPVLGKGQEGDVKEVFDNLFEAEQAQKQKAEMMKQQQAQQAQMMRQQQMMMQQQQMMMQQGGMQPGMMGAQQGGMQSNPGMMGMNMGMMGAGMMQGGNNAGGMMQQPGMMQPNMGQMNQGGMQQQGMMNNTMNNNMMGGQNFMGGQPNMNSQPNMGGFR